MVQAPSAQPQTWSDLPPDLQARLVKDEPFFLENLVEISDKSRKVVPFKRNWIQRKFDEDETGRDIVLKPAQIGFSSRTIAKILYRTITIPHTVSIIVAYDEFIAQRLLNKSQAFYDSIPKDFKPEMHHRSMHEKMFRDINSVFYIGSANSFTFARGEAIHNFLADEYAFWKEPEKIMHPALDRVVKPAEGGRFWVISTPNGVDNAFYEMYSQAKDPNTPFTPHFYTWYQHAEYRLSADSPSALPADRGPLENLDSDEITLLAKGVDEDQLRWRRLKIAEKQILRLSGETRVLFQQEYPSDDVSCFLTAGDMVYDADLINEKAKLCTDPIAKERGLWIWEYPDEKYRHQYHAAVDPGMGKQTKTAFGIWRFWIDEDDRPRGKVCAVLGELLDIHASARRAEEVLDMYFRPQLAPEVNGHGLALLHEIEYSNIWMREDLATARMSKTTPGWLTTVRTKPAMIKELMKMLPYLEIGDIRIIGELRNIREEEGKKDVYVSVGADDLHDMSAIAVITRPSQYMEYSMDSYGW